MSIAPVDRPVVDFDHHSETVSHHRGQVLSVVREHPIFYTEAHGGYWVVTTHELAKRVLKDPVVFSSAKLEDGSAGVTIPTVPGPRLIPAEADGKYHRALRKALSPKFNKPAVERMRPAVTAFIEQTIDRVIKKGEFDVVHDIADVVPAGVMVQILGFPEAERVPFIKSVQAALAVMPAAADIGPEGPSAEMQAGIDAFMHAVGVINALIAERRERPTDDLVSYLLQPEHELSDDEMLWLSFTLIVGGAENPAALIANTMLLLSENATLRQRLIDDPELIPVATEEFLRFVTAGVSLARNISEDVEVGGCQLRAGERILIWLPGANLDPEVFPNADEIDLTRAKCPHLAFGDGPHFCVGATLARLQIHVLLKEVLTRMPDFRVDTAGAVRFDDASTMYGYRTMPASTGHR